MVFSIFENSKHGVCVNFSVYPNGRFVYRTGTWWFKKHQLFSTYDIFFFFLQDKSSSIAPHSVKYLVGEDADIIHVNVGSGMTTAHIASLLEADSRSHIWAFGARNQAEVRENMEKLGVKGIVLWPVSATYRTFWLAQVCTGMCQHWYRYLHWSFQYTVKNSLEN